MVLVFILISIITILKHSRLKFNKLPTICLVDLILPNLKLKHGCFTINTLSLKQEVYHSLKVSSSGSPGELIPQYIVSYK